MGEPSATEPWGWQLDGHHLNLNYFVLGDQVVMTPAFWGSEPSSGRRRASTRAPRSSRTSRTKGLAMVRALTAAAAAKSDPPDLEDAATTSSRRPSATTSCWITRASACRHSRRRRRQQLLELVGLYVGNLRDGHARVHMADVEKRLDDTYFAWIGETERTTRSTTTGSTVPVILIEFDHETPVGLRGRYPAGVPVSRAHSRGRPDAERQRLRQGSAPAALPAAPALADPSPGGRGEPRTGH